MPAPAIPTLIAAPIIWGVLLWLAWIDSDPPGWINLMLRLTRDVLRGMPTIQMLGWEAAMLERIQQIRDGHLTAILRLRTLVFVATTLSLALAPLGVLAAVLIAWAQGVTLPVTFVLFINRAFCPSCVPILCSSMCHHPSPLALQFLAHFDQTCNKMRSPCEPASPSCMPLIVSRPWRTSRNLVEL